MKPLVYYANVASFAYSKWQNTLSSDIVPLGLTLIAQIHNTVNDTDLYVAESDESIFVVFRGTDTLIDALTDANALLKDFHTADGNFLAHEGFVKSYLSVKDQLFQVLANNPKSKKSIIACGHSLGGALSTIFALDAANNNLTADLQVYTFGSPRVGTRKFAKEFNKKVPNCHRVVVEYDVVPRVPFWVFWHVHTLIKIDKNGCKVSGIKGFFHWLVHINQMILSDITLATLRDHFMNNYIKVLELYNKNTGL